jgi:hypothetical protein
LLQRDVRFVADDRAALRDHVLLGDVELACLCVERSLGDCDLLFLVGIVDARQDRARLDRLPVIERESRSPGSVRGAASNCRPYRNRAPKRDGR